MASCAMKTFGLSEFLTTLSLDTSNFITASRSARPPGSLLLCPRQRLHLVVSPDKRRRFATIFRTTIREINYETDNPCTNNER
jgi:hypothetical protein